MYFLSAAFVFALVFIASPTYSLKSPGFLQATKKPTLCRLRSTAAVTSNSSENRKGKKYKKLLELVDYKRSPAGPEIKIDEDPMIPMVRTALRAADARKASSMAAFRVSHITEVTTFMVVIEGNSRPQNQVYNIESCV